MLLSAFLCAVPGSDSNGAASSVRAALGGLAESVTVEADERGNVHYVALTSRVDASVDRPLSDPAWEGPTIAADFLWTHAQLLGVIGQLPEYSIASVTQSYGNEGSAADALMAVAPLTYVSLVPTHMGLAINDAAISVVLVGDRVSEIAGRIVTVQQAAAAAVSTMRR